MPKISVGETDTLILCGGLGTRFRVVREEIPKVLAPVQGTPLIDLLLDDLIPSWLPENYFSVRTSRFSIGIPCK